jgi:hypothetical protein
MRYPTMPAMARAPPIPPPTPPPIAAAFELSDSAGAALPVTGGSADVVVGGVVSFETEETTDDSLGVLVVESLDVDAAVLASSDVVSVGLDVDVV